MLPNEACRVVVHATYVVERLGIRCDVTEQLQLDATPVHVPEDLVWIPTRRLLCAPAGLLHCPQICLPLFYPLRCIEVSVYIDPSIQLHGDLLWVGRKNSQPPCFARNSVTTDLHICLLCR